MRIMIVALIGLLLACQALAQIGDAAATLDQQTEQVTAAAVELTRDDLDLISLRESLVEARRDALRMSETLGAEREQVVADLERLGEPIEGEAANVTERRTRLQGQREALSAQISQAELNADEAERLLSEIAELRRTRFYTNVFERSGSPLQPSRLQAATGAVSEGYGRAESGLTNWIETRRSDGSLMTQIAILGVAIVFALLMAIPVRGWIQRQVTSQIEKLEPLGSRRILAAASKTITRAVPAIIAGFALYQIIVMVGLVGPTGVSILQHAWIGLVAIILVDGAATAILSPRSPAWRVIKVTDQGAFWIRSLAIAIAAVIVVDDLLRSVAALGQSDLTAGLTLRGLTAIILGGLIIAITRSWAWRLPPETEATTQPGLRKWTGPVGLVVGGGLIVSALVGYSAAAHFFATRVVFVVGLIAIAFAIRALLREGVRLLDSRFRSSEAADNDSERMLFFWVGLLVDLVVIAFTTPLIFLLFGSDWSDVRTVVQDALFGFQIGSVRISILQILTAMGLFALLLAATRFVQRTAETRVFPNMRMDVGVQNSLKTLIGYVGLVIAFMTGVGMLGFDLSNLAIIAGALSVGIGFGLQSIVNNFVSGLILLFERPIKVGDWIVTSSGEGIVKRISVRSTEIETFDRSSIIVPNSELISGSVTNWTHKNKLGRVTVPVGVSYNEDPDQILEILRGIPKDVDIVLNFPEPLILFVGFGDSSLDFEVRAFVSDVSSSLKARTELRVAIFKAFKAAGVEIPFPQRDLHLRSGPEGWKFGDTPASGDDTES